MAAEPTWRTEGSVLIGLDLVRSIMGSEGGVTEQAHAQVISWLSAEKSDFEDANGAPAPLYRIRYLDGALQGDEEDLEGYEVRNSVPDEDRRALAAREGVPYVPPKKRKAAVLPKKPSKKKKGGANAAAKKESSARPKKKKKRSEPSVVVVRDEAPRPLRRAAAQAALNRGFADGMMASAHRTNDDATRIGLARRAVQELTVETGAPKVSRREVTKKCRDLAGKLSRGDVVNETAKELADEDGYLHSDDEGITDLPLAAALVERALDALVEQGEIKRTGEARGEVEYSLVVDEDGEFVPRGDEKRNMFGKPPATYEQACTAPSTRASWRNVRRHVVVLPQGPEEDIVEDVVEVVEEEDPEMALAIRDACFEAARLAANDSDERPTKTAYAIFKESGMKGAVAATMDGHALNDDPAPGWYRELVARRSGDKVDAYYYPPDGTQLRSRPDVRRYFEANPSEAQVGEKTLDPQSDFQFAYSRVPAAEISRCKPLDRGAISLELRRAWDALPDHKIYEAKAEVLREEMARERLIAARTARDRAVEAATTLGCKDREARLAAARAAKQLFPDVDWDQLVAPSSPRPVEAPPTPSSKAMILELEEGEQPGALQGLQRRPRRAAAQAAPRTYSEKSASATDVVQRALDGSEGDPEASEGADWPQLCSIVAASERSKPLNRRCAAFVAAPYKATRDGLASLVKSGRARRDLCDLSGDRMLESEDPAVSRHERSECVLRALILAKLSPPRNSLAPLLPGNPKPSRRDPWNNRCIQVDGACGRLLPLDKASDGARKCILDDSRSADRRLTKEEVFQGAMRATPCVRFPELEKDPLTGMPVMVYWPMDRLFYEGLVVSSRQGPPLSEPPAYGQASQAIEHLVLYDDGSSEWLALHGEKVRYVQATRAAQLCGQVIVSLSAQDEFQWFAAPVEADALGLVDYHTIVTEPMDLGTVDDRIQRGYYDRTPLDDEDVDEELLSPLELDELKAKRIRSGAAADVRLTFANAVAFNSDARNACHQTAQRLLAKFEASALAGDNTKLPEEEEGPVLIEVEVDSDPDYSDDEDRRLRQRRVKAQPTATAPGRHCVEIALRFEQILSGMATGHRAEAMAPPPDFDLTRLYKARGKLDGELYRLRKDAPLLAGMVREESGLVEQRDAALTTYKNAVRDHKRAQEAFAQHQAAVAQALAVRAQAAPEAQAALAAALAPPAPAPAPFAGTAPAPWPPAGAAAPLQSAPGALAASVASAALAPPSTRPTHAVPPAPVPVMPSVPLPVPSVPHAALSPGVAPSGALPPQPPWAPAPATWDSSVLHERGGGGDDPDDETLDDMRARAMPPVDPRAAYLREQQVRAQLPPGPPPPGPAPLEPGPFDLRPVFRGRQHVEKAYYERSHKAALPSVPYLGRVANGSWEIRGALAKAALGQVLGGLVATGHVVELADGGFVAAHRYRRGTPYERRRLGGAHHVEEVELSEYELERRARIERNQAFLASLGFT